MLVAPFETQKRAKNQFLPHWQLKTSQLDAMNLVSTMVGLSIMGAATPMLMDMSLAPVIAQKKANNYASAESITAIYQAQNQSKTDISQLDPPPSDPGDCDLNTNGLAVTISCDEGDGDFLQTSKRSFVLTSSPTSSSSLRNNWPPKPTGFKRSPCHAEDDWGLNTSAYSADTNAWRSKPCMPLIVWNSMNMPNDLTSAFHKSDPNNWRYDINGFNAGYHKDY